jgi:hypothetical protein
MKSRSLCASLVCASLCLTPARAQAGAPFDPLQPKSPGWIVVALSLTAGAILTGASLDITCSHEEKCARWVSLGIWGGIGIASIGSVIGISMVKRDADAARARLSVAVDRSSLGVAPRVVLVGTF